MNNGMLLQDFGVAVQLNSPISASLEENINLDEVYGSFRSSFHFSGLHFSVDN